ncbi:TPA: nicotinate phosphoribosyltransferase [Candidatus Woesearchaeota archaeon]|nr:nicotinate phosphoribosyltransferase [Candidatus Woesearchaeota archaeon]
MSSSDGKTMLTDLYQLTMGAAYFDNGKNDTATFELFIRKLPEKWGYFVAAGIEDAIDYATNIKFEDSDIQYLREQRLFSEDYLSHLKDLHFEGDIYAVKEGTPVFPNEPLLRVTGPRDQAQFLESALLNIINSQTLIASKASRVVNAAAPAKVVDFGLRRAQGEDAAMTGARAAYIGGCVATSNVKAGKEYGIPISGTHAHSFVMSFDTELDAFRAYTKTFPDNATLLIDTYDTEIGARNACVVAKELKAKGHKLGAVRLDSGDLADLSKKVRKILDDANLPYVRIVASNDLNEQKIAQLGEKGAKIDGYGVGTEMITAKPVAAISGVYKLVEDGDGAKIKLSSGKTTYPGAKQVYRVSNPDGTFSHDLLALDSERCDGTPLLEPAVIGGERVSTRRPLKEIRDYSLAAIAELPIALRDIDATHHYDLKLSSGLRDLTERLTTTHRQPAAIKQSKKRIIDENPVIGLW